MADTADELTSDEGEIDVTVTTELVDLDGDGVADAVVETTTTLIDTTGDGWVDIVQETTVIGVDVDGDGEIDIIDETTITAADLDGDGEFSEDEVAIEQTTAVREDLLDD
jgi:hypothetical protein